MSHVILNFTLNHRESIIWDSIHCVLLGTVFGILLERCCSCTYCSEEMICMQIQKSHLTLFHDWKKLATNLRHGQLRLFVNQNFMLTCNKIKSHVNIIISHVNIFMLHVNIIMLHVDINKSHVNIVISHVDIIYLACRGQNYATIEHRLFLDNWFSGHMVKDHGVASGFRSKHRLFNIFQQLDCYHIFTNFNIYCSLEIFIMMIFLW